jgi:hypothetical protein
MTELERLAFLIALEAPEKQNKYARSATVPWDRVHEIRAVLGPRYDEARKRMKEIMSNG